MCTQPVKLHLVEDKSVEETDPFEQILARFQDPIKEGRVEIHRQNSQGTGTDLPDDYFDWVYVEGSQPQFVLQKKRGGAPRPRNESLRTIIRIVISSCSAGDNHGSL